MCGTPERGRHRDVSVHPWVFVIWPSVHNAPLAHARTSWAVGQAPCSPVNEVLKSAVVTLRDGLSIVELLICLVVSSVLTLAAGSLARADQPLARQFAGVVRSARMQAIVLSERVGVGDELCPLAERSVSPPGEQGLIVAVPPRGLMFTPDGLPRTCDGGGLGNTTILLTYRGRQAAVIVSALGRVRWEPR